MEIVKPNAFIVGVPKSGKVSLRYWLSQHPEMYVCMFDTDFFSADVEGNQRDRVNSIEKYLSYFKDGKGKKIVLDQVSRSAVSRVAAKKIKEFSPNAKIIINIRNPAEQMFSWHNTLRRIGFETERDFYKAIKLEKERRRKNKSDIIKNYYYRMVADYYPQVKRYIDIFGKKNVKVVLLDELRDEPEKTYYSILKFLGVKKFKADLSVQNETRREPRNQLTVHILNFLLNLPEQLRTSLKSLIPPKLVAKIRLKTVKEIKAKRKIDPKVKQEINKSFEKNLKKLENLIDKDLSMWYS
ncbi:MAG: sulfotransferase domain-containing protein [Nanoarchaeota archaeon]